MEYYYDLAVVGAGSSGIGAAIAGIRQGLSVLLIEQADTLGGTAVLAGVNNWEPVAGGTGIPFDIYKHLKHIPEAVGLYTLSRHCLEPKQGIPVFPGGENIIDSSYSYIDSMQRSGRSSDEGWCEFSRRQLHGVVFEPKAYIEVIEQMLKEENRCKILRNTKVDRVETTPGQITCLYLSDGQKIQAGAYIDSTGEGSLCQACGCKILHGQESQDVFNEPSAPRNVTNWINAVTLIYRVTRTDDSRIEALPSDIPADCWWAESFPVVVAAKYPCGDYNMNTLPTMEGREFLKFGYSAALVECHHRIRAHWHHAQTVFPEFQNYRLSWIAPTLGIRETKRVLGEYILTEHDLLKGLSKQTHEDIIAIADHAMDIHGEQSHCIELSEPYGIPYRCLIPKGFKNLLIACKASSFSSIAASSCRLSRTMIQLGQAAGTAVAIAKQLKVELPNVPIDILQLALRKQHVQLEWPISEELRNYLIAEDDPDYKPSQIF